MNFEKMSEVTEISSTIPRTAGTGTASAARAYRFNRGDTESGAWSGINIIDGNPATGSEQAFFDQEFQRIVFKNFVAVFWLIQSQSQRGTCSATLHQGHTQSRIDIIRLHVFF